MKVGLITIIGNDNYGNRLQNYAIQHVFNNLGIELVTIKNYPSTNTRNKFLLRCINCLFKGNTYSSNKKRKDNFKKFNKNINYSKRIITPFMDYFKYDYYIVGSDQVWNPYMGRLREVDLLAFTSPEKRVAFSASFGVDNIDDMVTNLISSNLKMFEKISVREDAGKKIVEKVTGRNDVEVLIDPTMLLSSNDWDKLTKKPMMLKNKKYILNYFLGELSDIKLKEIKRVAKENDCEIINILDEKSPFYECGPSEFLYLEKNAFLICTDSFHSCVFAILYNVPFIIFDREQKGVENMNSRIETLVSKLKIENRRFCGSITKDLLNYDYTEAYDNLKKEREKSNQFLKDALKLK